MSNSISPTNVLMLPQSAPVLEQWRQQDNDVLADLSPEMQRRIIQLRISGMSERTRRTYESAWREFSHWCVVRRRESLPASPGTVLEYLIDRSELVSEDGTPAYAPSTLRVWVSAINKMHRVARFNEPGKDELVKETLEAICRLSGRPLRQVQPLTTDLMRSVLQKIDLTDPKKGARAHRDYAILCLGLSGAFRRSELAALVMSDIRSMEGRGLRAFLRRSKTDQLARGQTKAIPFGEDPLTCPPCAFTRWVRLLPVLRSRFHDAKHILAAANVREHVCEDRLSDLQFSDDDVLFPSFRSGGVPTMKAISGDIVADIVKERLEAAGHDPRDYSGHSLRAGFVTQAYRAGASTHEIMRQTGHKNPAMVEVYAREVDPFVVNAAHKLGL